jgi:hypothetical protein
LWIAKAALEFRHFLPQQAKALPSCHGVTVLAGCPLRADAPVAMEALRADAAPTAAVDVGQTAVARTAAEDLI